MCKIKKKNMNHKKIDKKSQGKKTVTPIYVILFFFYFYYYKMEIIIRTNKPNIKDKTVRTYVDCIKNISAGINIPLETVDDLNVNYEPIMAYLMTLKITSRKTKLAAIRVALKNSDDEVTNAMYKAQMMADGAILKDRAKKQIHTASVIKNYLPWETVLNRLEELRKETLPLWKLERINAKQFLTLQNYVLLSCYTLIEPRRAEDFSEFKIRNYDQNKDNFMIYSRTQKSTFVFNNYKMAFKLGQQRVEIPNTLKKIIFEWCKKNPYDYLFVNTRFTKTNQSRIYTFLDDIFEIDKNDPEQHISVNSLRHSWNTYMYKDVPAEQLQNTANNMGCGDISRVLAYVVPQDKESIVEVPLNAEDECVSDEEED